jgi:hypothetical protein
MGELNAMQRSFLRYWARNLGFARRTPGFDYSPAEEQRLAAMGSDVTDAAFDIWLLVAAVAFVFLVLPLIGLIAVAPILYWYPDKTAVPAPLVMAALALVIVLTLVVGLPLAMGTAGQIVDRLCRLPPLKEVEGDAALFRKIRGQIIRVTALGVAGVGLLALIRSLLGR